MSICILVHWCVCSKTKLRAHLHTLSFTFVYSIPRNANHQHAGLLTWNSAQILRCRPFKRLLRHARKLGANHGDLSLKVPHILQKQYAFWVCGRGLKLCQIVSKIIHNGWLLGSNSENEPKLPFPVKAYKCLAKKYTMVSLRNPSIIYKPSDMLHLIHFWW